MDISIDATDNFNSNQLFYLANNLFRIYINALKIKEIMSVAEKFNTSYGINGLINLAERFTLLVNIYQVMTILNVSANRQTVD